MDLPSLGNIADAAQIGILLTGFKMAFTKIERIGTKVTELWAEHNTYKELNKCPLINSAHKD
jgi:hypothetical protein